MKFFHRGGTLFILRCKHCTYTFHLVADLRYEHCVGSGMFSWEYNEVTKPRFCPECGKPDPVIESDLKEGS